MPRRKGFVLGKQFARSHWRDWDKLDPQQRRDYESYYEAKPEESLPFAFRSKGLPHPFASREGS